MKLRCWLLGHSWLEPEWEAYDLWQTCGRCSERRAVVSLETLSKRFGLSLLSSVPPDVSVTVLDRSLRSQRDANFARSILQELGLLKNTSSKAPLPVVLVPPIWLPILRLAIEDLASSSQVACEGVRTFFSSFGVEAMPHLLQALQSELCLPGEQLSETVVGTTQIEEPAGSSAEEEHGGSMGRYERGYYNYSNVYKADLVQRTFKPSRPIFEGAKDALLRIATTHPEHRTVIEQGIAEGEAKNKGGHITLTTPENKQLVTTHESWVSTYRDVDAR